jgi:benzoyl-CoA reductase/2-hydroxyglutaryl-CoA dehydratase subunit BcrC/BadD/HgdB
VLAEQGAKLSGLFMYNACDTLRNIPEILKWGLAEDGRTLPVFTIHIPMGTSGRGRNSIYLKQEIATLIRELEDTFAVSFSAKRFVKSIKTYDKMRNLLKQMDVLVAAGELQFDEYAQFARQGCLRPVDQQIKNLKSRMQEFDSLSLDSLKNKIHTGGVVFSGILPPPPGISQAIENANLRIVFHVLLIIHPNQPKILKNITKAFINITTLVRHFTIQQTAASIH